MKDDVELLVVDSVDDEVDEPVVEDVVVMVLDEVDVLELVLVEDEVVDTDVVALDVSVDVTVVEGDVISHPRKVPASCLATRSFSAAANNLRSDSPVPSVSSSPFTSNMTCTFPLKKSVRHPTSNVLPSAFPPAKSVTSLVNPASPTAVTARHELVLPDKSTMLYRETLPPSSAHPSSLDKNRTPQSARANKVLSTET